MKTAVVVRYGGIGDMFQASSVLPGLKAQGFRVVVNTTPEGKEVIRHDPHVDDWIIQERGAVPQEQLGEFWKKMSDRCDRFINLSESVEGTLYPIPGRPAYYWPHEARRLWLGSIDIIELTHAIAGVPYRPSYRFYRTRDEARRAQKCRRKLRGRVILWVLSGSSVHKSWPYLDQIIARIMLRLPDVKVVLTGEPDCVLLEQGWEREIRVIRKSGKWTIRDTLSFAPEADLIIGPETGILYGMGLMPVPKIVTLSHSSIGNLYRHWTNCTTLIPDGCPCYPCHQLHYGFDFCRRDDETGVALCQARISAEDMWQAILRALGERK